MAANKHQIDEDSVTKATVDEVTPKHFMEVPSLSDMCVRICANCLIGTPSTSSDVNSVRVGGYLTNLLRSPVFDCVSGDILTHLVKFYPEDFDDRCLQVTCPPHLKRITLKDCKKLSLAGVTQALRRVHKLQYLDLTWCKQLVEVLWDPHISSTLTSLTLESCSTLTDSTVQNVLRGAPNLRHLNVSYCEKLTDAVFLLDPILQFNREAWSETTFEDYDCHLTSVDVSGCYGINSFSIYQLATLTGPTLKHVNISGCRKVDIFALLYLCGLDLVSIVSIIQASQPDVKASELLIKGLEQLHQARKDFVEMQEKNQNEYFICECCASCYEDNLESEESNRMSDKCPTTSTCDSEEMSEKIPTSFTRICTIDHDGTTDHDDTTEGSFDERCTPSCVEHVKDMLGTSASSWKPEKVIVNRSSPSTSGDFTCTQLYSPGLISFDASSIGLRDAHPNTIMTCLDVFLQRNQNLTKFVFFWRELTNEMIPLLASKSEQLKDISLHDCHQVTGTGVQALGECCKDIERLDLRGVCFTSDSAVKPLVMNKKLEQLCLSECPISDATLGWISECLSEQLESLDISRGGEEVTLSGLNRLFSKWFPRLTSLNLREGPVSNFTLGLLADHCPALTSLNLSFVKFHFEDDTVINLAKKLSHLKDIDMQFNSGLTDRSVDAFLRFCPKLTTIMFRGIKRISSEPFAPLIEGNGDWMKIQLQLEEIKNLIEQLRQTQGTRETTLSQFLEGMEIKLPFRSTVFAPNLTDLNLGHCECVNDLQLAKITAVCRGSLKITGFRGGIVKPSWISSLKGI